MKYGRKERGHYERESHKQGLTSAENLNVELSEERESHYYRLDYLTNQRPPGAYVRAQHPGRAQ